MDESPQDPNAQEPNAQEPGSQGGTPPERRHVPADGPLTTPGRNTSVRLREGDGEQSAALMDPANQSLADALKITFTLLQVAMVVLAGLFVFSGFQTVREGERGISVLFGKAVASDLEPGFHFAAPYPFGELVKVETGNVAPRLDREFWPNVPEGQEGASLEFLPTRAKLDPEREGSLITADLNIAHTQWQAVYRRVDPVKYIRNIYTEDEREIVRSALQRGVVRTIATISVDELLKPQDGGTRAIAERAREIAQSTLDAIESGITIEQFELSRRTPPGTLQRKFRAVLDARSQAQTAITEARARRDGLLNEAAGEAAEPLLWLIARYEAAIEGGTPEEASAVLTRIDAMLEGSPVVAADAESSDLEDPSMRAVIARSEGKVASGEVVEIIQDAVVDRLTLVQDARGDLDHFSAKLAQYNANPSLMIRRDWARAWTAFQGQDFVQTMWLPVGSMAEIRLNEDPDIIKLLDKAQKQRESVEALQQRRQERLDNRFKVDRSTLIEDN